jgi:hypothetical protein
MPPSALMLTIILAKAKPSWMKTCPFNQTQRRHCVAFSSLKKDIHDRLPPEFFLSWAAKDLEAFHSCEWWANLLSKSRKISIKSIGELSCHDECWRDWLATDNPYAVWDRPAMEAGAVEAHELDFSLGYPKTLTPPNMTSVLFWRINLRKN